jgi:hypothetical protein
VGPPGCHGRLQQHLSILWMSASAARLVSNSLGGKLHWGLLTTPSGPVVLVGISDNCGLIALVYEDVRIGAICV